MAIGKISGVSGSSFIRPIIRRLATDPAQRDQFVLRGTIAHVDTGRRRFALFQEGHAYNVGWTTVTEFVGIDAASMQGREVCVKGRLKVEEYLAESVVAAR